MTVAGSSKVSLSGRVAVVTGAGKGLGRAYALHLAAQGARVVVNNRRHLGEADADTSAMQTVQAIRATGGEAEADWSDVADPKSGEAMVGRALSHFGRLDIVVANAGIDHGALFHKQSLAEFRAILDVGFLGNLHLAHAAWPRLIGQGYGRVILTASSAGLYGNRGQSAYSAAKAAVMGLARALAIEGRRHAVAANVILPYGYTQMTAPFMEKNAEKTFDPAQVAPLVGWLASEACDVSGEVLVCGAGIVRRATTAESAAMLLDAEQPGDTVHALTQSKAPGQSYP
ncbi:MAG TPA: SDR family NAD(P)-dependent oxidoreductase, partial [Burkholderiales bacterium]|nr:SDR family NAD(P)-dependent oxidoreductase [Burkholderiales bacterium]